MTDGDETQPGPPAVSFIGVRVSYDREPILRDISFTVRPGTTTVVMGPSGIGKTTLMRVLLGLVEPDDGDVTIGGRSVVDADRAELKEIRADVGAMLGGHSVHDGSIFGSLTAWENVRYPLEAHGHDEAGVEELGWPRMLEFGLGEHANKRPAELSGGQRRRVALARAFVEGPSLLVLDDPGTALDLANREQIVESIRKAKATTDATVILTCHDIAMAKALGDDLVVLLAGRVGAAGPVSELLDGVENADDYDERFSVLATFAQDSSESLAQYRTERSWRTNWERLVLYTGLVAGIVTIVGLVVMWLANPANW